MLAVLMITAMVLPFVLYVISLCEGRRHAVLRALVPLAGALPLAAVGFVAAALLLASVGASDPPGERLATYVGAAVFLLMGGSLLFLGLGLARIALGRGNKHDANDQGQQTGGAGSRPSGGTP